MELQIAVVGVDAIEDDRVELQTLFSTGVSLPIRLLPVDSTSLPPLDCR